jgi:hypothetical protein
MMFLHIKFILSPTPDRGTCSPSAIISVQQIGPQQTRVRSIAAKDHQARVVCNERRAVQDSDLAVMMISNVET